MNIRGLSDPGNPFGLPEGSVRAVLTISFIVLVGVLSAFLITSHNNRSPFAANGQVVGRYKVEQTANNDAVAMRAQFGVQALVVVNEVVDGTSRFHEIVVYPRADNSMGDDIAKQTLTMISTILAAMIGFYFGERGSVGRTSGEREQSESLRTELAGQASRADTALRAAIAKVNAGRAEDAPDVTATEIERQDYQKKRLKLMWVSNRLQEKVDDLNSARTLIERDSTSPSELRNLRGSLNDLANVSFEDLLKAAPESLIA